ncbi:MAG: Rpn family recombination-promoting nuclease/putative transposase [Bacteroidales bacterium]
MSKVNPKIDLVFKKLFGTEKNINLLKSLVNSILPQNEQVTTLELKNPYNPSDYISGKISYLDIKATDENGKWYDIEIQVAPYDFFGMRLLFYWAKMYSSQLKSKQTYEDLRKTIVISLINFNYFVDTNGQERYHRRIGLTDLDTKEIYEQTDGLELIFVELKKFQKELPDVHTTLERWITFLNKAHEYSKDNLPKELATEEIKKAMEELEVMYFNDLEQEHYESQQRRYLDEDALAKQEERKIENAVKIAKLETEFDTKIEIAKEMKLANEPIDKIMKFTGLIKDQIDKL